MQAYKVLDDILILSAYLKSQQISDYDEWYEYTVKNMLTSADNVSASQLSENEIGELQRYNFHHAVLSVFTTQINYYLKRIEENDRDNYIEWYRSNLEERIHFAREIYDNRIYADALDQFDEIKNGVVAKASLYVSASHTTGDGLSISLLQCEQNIAHLSAGNWPSYTHSSLYLQVKTNQMKEWVSYALAKCYQLFFFASTVENESVHSPARDNQLAQSTDNTSIPPKP